MFIRPGPPSSRILSDIPHIIAGSGHQSSYSGFDGNSEADAGGQSAPLATSTGADGGLLVLMAVFPVIKAHVSRGFPLDDDRRMDQAGPGRERSVQPTRIDLRIAIKSPNSYSDAKNRCSSGECRLTPSGWSVPWRSPLADLLWRSAIVQVGTGSRSRVGRHSPS